MPKDTTPDEDDITDLRIDHDALVSFIADLKEQEADASSEAGERRQQIGEFVERTGVHKAAFATIRKLDKMSAEKRADWLRSFFALHDEMTDYWQGNSTPDMLESGKVVPIDGGDE